jgi:[FeFe] hydrogenase H-cluster maturation GTPase HydF
MPGLNETPNSSRLHIAIFGRRNAGKSSLINALTKQTVSLVSEVAGTTTDPVSKSMELLPLGPVVLIDTAGIDDQGHLGELRVKRTFDVLNRTDLAILVLDGTQGAGEWEEQILGLIREKKLPVVGVVNKVDAADYSNDRLKAWQKKLGLALIEVSSLTGQGIEELKQALIRKAPALEGEPPLVSDLVNPGEVVVLVTPIDGSAPKGRLILPQQQVIRDLLDHGVVAMVAREKELVQALKGLKQRPALVITDSQAFAEVSALTPPDLRLTSFSIVMARYKGDLDELVKGAQVIESLQPGDRVLIAEACTHHRQADDLGTVKIPRWLRQKVGGELDLHWSTGFNFPSDLGNYKLIIHCAGCMLNRREMLYRIGQATRAGLPIVNYGVLIAYLHGILPRALAPFLPKDKNR